VQRVRDRSSSLDGSGPPNAVHHAFSFARSDDRGSPAQCAHQKQVIWNTENPAGGTMRHSNLESPHQPGFWNSQGAAKWDAPRRGFPIHMKWGDAVRLIEQR